MNTRIRMTSYRSSSGKRRFRSSTSSRPITTLSRTSLDLMTVVCPNGSETRLSKSQPLIGSTCHQSKCIPLQMSNIKKTVSVLDDSFWIFLFDFFGIPYLTRSFWCTTQKSWIFSTRLSVKPKTVLGMKFNFTLNDWRVLSPSSRTKLKTENEIQHFQDFRTVSCHYLMKSSHEYLITYIRVLQRQTSKSDILWQKISRIMSIFPDSLLDQTWNVYSFCSESRNWLDELPYQHCSSVDWTTMWFGWEDTLGYWPRRNSRSLSPS